MVAYQFEVRSRTFLDKLFRRQGTLDSSWVSEDKTGLPRIGDKLPVEYGSRVIDTYRVFDVVRATQTREDVPYDTSEKIGNVPDSLDRVLVDFCEETVLIKK